MSARAASQLDNLAVLLWMAEQARAVNTLTQDIVHTIEAHRVRGTLPGDEGQLAQASLREAVAALHAARTTLRSALVVIEPRKGVAS